MSVHPIVLATIRRNLADAELTVARLESQAKTVPALSGTSNSRLTLSKRLTEARRIHAGWVSVEREARG